MKNLIKLLFVFILSVNNLMAITLAWDSSTDTNVIGYNIRYGTNTGNYSITLNVNNVNIIYIDDTNLFQPPLTNFIVATAYEENSIESLPSNEISYKINVAPIFSSIISNQTYTMFTFFPQIPFTIYDNDSLINKLKFKIVSSNTNIFSCLGAFIYGNGTNKFLAFYPPSEEDVKRGFDIIKEGEVQISIIVNDDNYNYSTNKFLLIIKKKQNK